MRWIVRALATLIGLTALAVAAAVWIYRDIPTDELELKYASPPSQFVEVDGVRFHYRDEGQGPVIVLIHANWANMLDWEPWVAALKDQYRVVRFDMTGFGLTGPDPTGDYSVPRTVDLLHQFTRALGLEHFTLTGASLGGTIAMHYSVTHPGRAERIVLVSPGALNPSVRGRSTPTEMPRTVDIVTVITPKAVPRRILEGAFGDPARVTEALVTRWHDFMLRDGNRAAQLARQRQYISGDIDTLIGRIDVPVLIMWGQLNKQVPVELADELVGLLVRSPKVDTVIYPTAGHQLVQEIGPKTGADMRRYLDSWKTVN
jgi:pimeloyl-ACP methyl ester carboxylesterase